MIKAADTSVGPFLSAFSSTGVRVAFLVPTATGYRKAIMDATGPVRDLFMSSGLHEYADQLQGPEHKRTVDAYFVENGSLTKTHASLYRPRTKTGDPRLWFSGLKQYCEPYNLLALVVAQNAIYVMNLSNRAIAQSLLTHSFVYRTVLEPIKSKGSEVEEELLTRLRALKDVSPLPTVTAGDPGVGNTLEHALGIHPNNSKIADYKGIELKASRKTRDGKIRSRSRTSLFTQVPDGGMTYRQILEKYGKWQIPHGDNERRLQVVDTLSTMRVNGYGLTLDIDDINDRLYIIHVDDEGNRQFVSWWNMAHLRERLLEKHPKTFWVEASSEMIGGVENFTYTEVLYTSNPNASLLTPLIASGEITVDLAAHFEKSGNWRDHGMSFKLGKKSVKLLFPEAQTFSL